MTTFERKQNTLAIILLGVVALVIILVAARAKGGPADGDSAPCGEQVDSAGASPGSCKRLDNLDPL